MITDGKASIYEFFANIFSKEPTLEFLRLFQLEENKKFFSSYGADPFSDITHLSLPEQKEALAAEYTRLFLAPPRPAAPYESLQEGEGRLWGEKTVAVNDIYKKFGFELDDYFKETPDHVSAELAFLGRLSELESKYANEGLLEAKDGVLKVKKYFLENHFLVWFPRFKEAVDKYANLFYYKAFTLLLSIFMNEDIESINQSGETIE